MYREGGEQLRGREPLWRHLQADADPVEEKERREHCGGDRRAGHEDAVSSTLISNRLEATFTNLKNGKETDWLDFKDGSGRTSWEYRLLLAIPEGDAEEKFRAFVTTIKLEADLDEASWLTLVNDSTHNFSATIDVLNIVVLKSFSDKNPLQ